MGQQRLLSPRSEPPPLLPAITVVEPEADAAAADGEGGEVGTAPATPAGPLKPYSQVLADRKRAGKTVGISPEAIKRRPSKRRRAKQWSTNASGNGDSSSMLGDGRSAAAGARLRRWLLRRAKHKLKPRTLIYGLFAGVEALMLAAFLLSAYANGRAVNECYEQAVTDGLSSVHVAYMKKVHQLQTFLQTTRYNADLKGFLREPPTGDGAAAVAALLQHASHVFQTLKRLYAFAAQAEFFTLLDADMVAVANVNSNHTLGRRYDPEGIVTAAQQAGTAPVWTYSLLPYDELLAEHPPLYRDRESELDQVLSGTHPYETHEDALVRWAAIAIHDLDLGDANPSAALIGYAVLGDIVKASATSLISISLDGLGGVYQRRRETVTNETEHTWLTSAASSMLTVDSFYNGKRTVQDTLVQGEWTPRVLECTVEATGSGRPPVVLSRGVEESSERTSVFMLHQWLRLGVLVMADVATLVLTTWLFLAPLEAMGRRIRAGQAVDLKLLRSLTHRRHYLGVIALVAVFSLLAGVSPGNVFLAYRQGMDLSSRILTTLQVSTTLRAFLNASSPSAQQTAAVCQHLGRLEETLFAEFALLFDASGALVAANGSALVRAQLGADAGVARIVWVTLRSFSVSADNGARIVSDALATGLRYTRSALTKASVYQAYGARQWVDRYFNTTPISHLHPSNTSINGTTDVLTRWVACPVWADAQATGGPPSGVLVTGDAINGKTRAVELGNSMSAHGYTAIYYFSEDRTYQMATGIIRSADGTFEVDVPMPATEWLDKLRQTKEWLNDNHYAVTTHANFRQYGNARFVLSARCLNKDTVIRADGAETQLSSWHGDDPQSCEAYLVQGLPWSVVAPALAPSQAWQQIFSLDLDVRRSGATCTATLSSVGPYEIVSPLRSAVAPALAPSQAWQWVFICMVVIKLLTMAYLCHRAYQPFNKIVVRNKVRYMHWEGAVTSPRRDMHLRSDVPKKVLCAARQRPPPHHHHGTPPPRVPPVIPPVILKRGLRHGNGPMIGGTPLKDHEAAAMSVATCSAVAKPPTQNCSSCGHLCGAVRTSGSACPLRRVCKRRALLSAPMGGAATAAARTRAAAAAATPAAAVAAHCASAPRTRSGGHQCCSTAQLLIRTSAQVC
ncbi:hypothetical protein JKP88DRAFT_255042 [Tribonema minus]|uniref:Uncharacterized protein n=1 Tax=Tribonema minus TaxID=303371 RepID=A0A835Z884_9STRA|nr:hypothetical protein JKP88DRAFT_255042 [Tribonema minus]